ncbi:MAG: hypothetical protein U0930_00265 [Pirellulales bacterium]
MFKKFLLASLFFLSIGSTIWAQNAPISYAKSIVHIDAGTVINAPNATRWNRTILLAKPRISSGEVGQLTENIRQAASLFVLSIAATVDQDPQAAEPKFRLAEVGVGYSVPVADQLKVVHSDDYASHGVNLSFIPRQMLSENEKQIGNIKTTVRANSLLMFDVPAMLLQNNKHVDFTMRHLIWIDTKTGKLATMVWLMQADRSGKLSIVSSEPIRKLEPNTVEDRAIHVDGGEFTLGIPSKRAFALESMPPGKQIAWTQATATLAALESYDISAIQALLRALNEASLASPTTK